LASQLKTRLTYAAIKVEHGWEKHSLQQIQTLLNEQETHPLSKSPATSRRRSNTFTNAVPYGSPPPHSLSQPFNSQYSPQSHSQQLPSISSGLGPAFNDGKLTYESFWAQQTSRPNMQTPPRPRFHGTFPRRKPERLTLQSPERVSEHTARDQSAAEIMIALASPRTRSEFSSPERSAEEGTGGSPTRPGKRLEVDGDVDGFGIRT
jgi:Whi5 like